MPKKSEYRELLEWAFLGEVWGQHMLEQLLESNVFPSEIDSIQILLALETQTRLSLKTLIDEDSQIVVPEGDALHDAEDYATKLERSADWDAWMAETKDLTAGFLPEIRASPRIGFARRCAGSARNPSNMSARCTTMQNNDCSDTGSRRPKVSWITSRNGASPQRHNLNVVRGRRSEC